MFNVILSEAEGSNFQIYIRFLHSLRSVGMTMDIMLFNIPQFIDKEDKIVGPLTAKQLGWLAGGGTVLLVLWNVLDKATFYIAAIFVSMIAGALAFYHPNGQPLISFIFSSFSFITRPKVYLWKRVPEKEIKKAVEKKKNEITKVRKEVNSAKIEELSKLLDRR